MKLYSGTLKIRVVCFFFLICYGYTGFSFSEDIRYQAGERRDPFIPITREPAAVAENSQISGIQIEGIIYDPLGESLVVIRGETYKEGDSVDNQKIIKIFSSKIVTLVQDSEREYWIPGSEPKLIQKDKE